MSFPSIKTQINNFRKEAIKIGYCSYTIDRYISIWNMYIKWKNETDFIYDSDEYSKFLLEHYNFDVNTYTSKSKSFFQQLMRSKRILDNFDEYRKVKEKEMFSKSYIVDFPNDWNITIGLFADYIQNVRNNCDNTIKVKIDYLKKELSYFHNQGLNCLCEFSSSYINKYISDTINAGNISKRRNFYILREFLDFLLINNVIETELSSYIPKIKSKKRKKLPCYIKQDKVEELLSIIPREKAIEKRNYAIILIAARLGLRINDILNIKLKDIDWKNNKMLVFQTKNYNLNSLPLLKDIGWAIINYIKVRPKCDNEYLFIQHKYPFPKLNKFIQFNKYFDKADIETNNDNKKGIHNLRHSLAKNMLENDIPLEIIASTLGDTVDSVSNTYLKVDEINLKKCILEVEE